MGSSAPGTCKPPPPRRLLSWSWYEVVETKWSENETRLGAEGLPRRAAAGLLRQYWFITQYIAPYVQYIQARLFTVQGTCCTQCAKYIVHWSLSGSRGVASSPQGSLRSADLGGGKVRGQASLVVSAGIVGTAAVEAGKEQTARDVQPPPKHSLSWSWYEGVETRWSGNEARLGAEELPRQVCSRLGHCAGIGQSVAALQTAWFGVRVRAELE